MADTRRTWSALATLLATNAAGAISAQDLRDFLASAQPHEATSDPGASDDGTDGYDLGSVWWNSSGETLHVCVDNTTSAAAWIQVYPGSISDVDLADGGSGTATLGQVPTADGSGGVAWDDPAGGVDGPASSTDGNLAAFDGTDGDTLKDSGKAASDFATAAQGSTADTAVQPGDDAATLGSGTATDGQVLTADGSGGAAWEDAAGGGDGAPTLSFIVACSDETSDLTTGAAKVTFRMPYAFTLAEVRASVTTAPTGAALTADINEGGSSILSTKLTIDAGEKTSTSAATPPVISDTALADDAEITIDIDQVGSTIAGAGLKVTLIGTKT